MRNLRQHGTTEHQNLNSLNLFSINRFLSSLMETQIRSLNYSPEVIPVQTVDQASQDLQQNIMFHLANRISLNPFQTVTVASRVHLDPSSLYLQRTYVKCRRSPILVRTIAELLPGYAQNSKFSWLQQSFYFESYTINEALAQVYVSRSRRPLLEIGIYATDVFLSGRRVDIIHNPSVSSAIYEQGREIILGPNNIDLDLNPVLQAFSERFPRTGQVAQMLLGDCRIQMPQLHWYEFPYHRQAFRDPIITTQVNPVAMRIQALQNERLSLIDAYNRYYPPIFQKSRSLLELSGTNQQAIENDILRLQYEITYYTQQIQDLNRNIPMIGSENDWDDNYPTP